MENNNNLFRKVGELGYPLFETEEHADANEILADVVKSGDSRLWQGFPVMLANSAKRALFEHNQVLSLLKSPKERDHFRLLLLMSLALYRVLNLKFAWAAELSENLSPSDEREIIKILKKLKADEDLALGQVRMSAEKIKSTFQNYFEQTRSKLENLLSVREEFGLEYSLSQIFSPKQKELFLKKLRREKLSKTEKEYFSRVVKKKVLALANPDLHRLARRLIE